MNNRNWNIYRAIKPVIALTCLSVTLLACADKSAIREQERERYAELEGELIDAQAAEERRRQSEMRIAAKLRQLDSERTQRALERAQISNLPASSSTILSGPANAGSTGPQVVQSGPVVTQIVVAGNAADLGNQIWSLQDYPSPVDGSSLCAVVSEPVSVQNGSLDTQVTVVIANDAVYLRTDATFDKSAPETGFRIDAGFPIAFDEFLNELTAVVDTSYARLRESIDLGTTLTASFAYSPQLSSSETHVIELSLDSIERPLDELSACKQTNPDETTTEATAES